jgi:Lon-like ATP-dependent protease
LRVKEKTFIHSSRYISMKFKTTADVPVPTRLIDQIIGQEMSVDIMKKAARQKRNVLLIGPPGTGKSMLAQAMAELMECERLEDVLAYPNKNNENQPLVRVVRTYPDQAFLMRNRHFARFYTPKELQKIKKLSKDKDYPQLARELRVGLGRRMTQQKKLEEDKKGLSSKFLIIALGIILLFVVFFAEIEEGIKWLIVAIALGIGFLYVISNATAGLGRKLMPTEQIGPKLIVDNSGRNDAPFIDATGTRAGSLLGDVKHDPLQSGGLGTPAHLRVEAGSIHQANKGVLFIDEIASLKLNWQQEILTAMQEKKYPLMPSDFVLVAAGNLPDMKAIHPALRSRIRGGGYEVYVEDSMDDTPENEGKLITFVAQEIKKDGKVPHFEKEAVMEVIEEARRMSGRRKKFTLNLRELGGLIRASGDVAKSKKHKLVTLKDVMEAKKIFRSIESQLGAKMIEVKREYQTIATEGSEVGRVNGLAVLGHSRAGLVLPIVAEATPSASRSEGRVIATGKRGVIAKEAVDNVSAIFKKYIGTTISQMDLHIQFLQTYEGVEGDSASISTAVAVISALSNIPVHQNVAMTGSLDVRGKVLPVGGVTSKIEAAIEAGIKKVLIPAPNAKDVYLKNPKAKKVNLVKVHNINDVLKHALKDCAEKKKLLKKMSG